MRAPRINPDLKPLPSIQITPDRAIGDDQPCFIVAEVGQNHNGSMETARELLENIAFYKADAAKFCKRDIPSEMTAEMYHQPYIGPQSFGDTYGKHREALELTREQYAQLKAFVEPKGPIFFATACDVKSVEDLEEIGVPLYKVASRDLTNLPLIETIARTGKPVVFSSGMDSLVEIKEALDTVRRFHNDIVVCQCTSSYPTPYEEVNLLAMHHLRREFDVLVGMSDHTIGIMVPVAAAALGAVLVEKHVTLARHMKGTDHAGSLEPDGLRRIVRDIRNLELSLGDGVKRVSAAASGARSKLGRSLVSRSLIPRGTVISEDHLCLKSPGTGLLWRERDAIVGKRAVSDIQPDTTMQLMHVAE